MRKGVIRIAKTREQFNQMVSYPNQGKLDEFTCNTNEFKQENMQEHVDDWCKNIPHNRQDTNNLPL